MALPLPPHPLAVETSVADYGVALAYVTHLKDEAPALELLAIDKATWARAGAWPLRLADEVSSGQTRQVAAFGVAFKETQERLRAAAPPVDAPAPDTSPAAAGPGLLGQLSNEALARPAPPLEVPVASAPALRPRSQPAPPPEIEPPSAAPSTRPTADLDSTTAVSPVPPFLASLPFTPSDGRAVPAAVAPPAPVAPPRPAIAAAPVKRPEDPLGATLPFQAAPQAPALPFRAQQPHELTLEQYASLCATLDCFPDKTAVILQRYGLGEARELERLHGAWKARFASDAASHAAWQRYVTEIRARLKGAP